MIGAQHFSNPRQDGVQDFIVTKALVKEYKEMTDHCFEDFHPKTSSASGDSSETRTPQSTPTIFSTSTTLPLSVSMESIG